MAFATLALAAGGAKVLTGLAGARNRAQGMLDSGTDTLLTARSNINQRKLEAQQVQFQILESGHQAASIVQRESRKAEGSARATAGGSGAVLDNGTPQAVLTNILQEGLNAQRDVILNARQRMKSVRRDTDNQNKSEWKEAKDYMGRMRGDAKKTIANSRMQAVADIAETALNVYSAGTAGGTKAFSWGLKGAKTAQTVGSTASNVAAGMSSLKSAHSISQNTKGGGGNTRAGFTRQGPKFQATAQNRGDRTALRTGGRHLPPPLPGQDHSYLRGTWRHGIGRSKYGWKPTTARRSGGRATGIF